MFEISWSEILVIGVVALIVVGPKDLPVLLRTVGKYMGVIRRQAAEFRAQFDEAMRETELEQLKKEMESIKSDAEGTLREAEHAASGHIADARREFDAASGSIAAPSHQPALPVETPASEPEQSPAAVDHAVPSAGAAAVAAAAAAARREPEKSGA